MLDFLGASGKIATLTNYMEKQKMTNSYTVCEFGPVKLVVLENEDGTGVAKMMCPDPSSHVYVFVGVFDNMAEKADAVARGAIVFSQYVARIAADLKG